MAPINITEINQKMQKIQSKCQLSSYQLKINVGLVFLGVTFDLLNVASMISLIEDLSKTYNITYTTASWSLTSYAITFAGFIAFMGRLGDIIGNSVLFTISCACFAILSLLCAVMPNFAAFAVIRALQGISAAGLVPCGYALIPILAPKEEVQKYFSIVSCGFSSTIGLGLIIGGAFAASKIGYKGVFYLTFGVMTIISIMCFFFTYNVEKCEDEDEEKVQHMQTNVGTLDFAGSLVFVAGSALIVVGLTEGGESWKRPASYVTLIFGILLFFGFFVWNCSYTKFVNALRRTGVDTSKYFDKVQLLIPVNVLFMKNFIPIVLAFALNNASLFSSIYVIDQYSQYKENNSPLLAGVKLVPLIICMIIGNGLCAFDATKMRPRVGVSLGFFLALGGSIVLAQLHLIKEYVFWKIFLVAQMMVGFGVAIFYPYALQLAVGVAPAESKGIASGVAQTFGQLGVEITFSVMASVLGNINGIKNEAGSSERFKIGFRNCAYFTVAVSALGFLLTVFCIRNTSPDVEEVGLADSTSFKASEVEIAREMNATDEDV